MIGRRWLVGLLGAGCLVVIGTAGSHPRSAASHPRSAGSRPRYAGAHPRSARFRPRAAPGLLHPGRLTRLDPALARLPAPGHGRVSVNVTIARDAPSIPLAASFLGFSTEYWGLPIDARHLGLFARLVSLVRVPGDPRFVLRIGGNSSDHSFWEPAQRRWPRWMFRLTPRWIRAAADVTRASRLRVIFDLNLVTGTPRLAAAWARRTLAAMPHGSVIGFEIGNEPDIYDRTFWLDHIGDAVTRLLPETITPASYAQAYARYAASVSRPAPGVPLLAPALALPNHDRAWVAALLASAPAHLGAVSVHDYPFTACASPAEAMYPSVARLLGQRATAGMAAAVRPAVRLAAAHALRVRVTEFNSVTCGGVDGVSDSFATALWAPDALLSLARAGVSAADLHVRAYSVNSPFRFHRGRVSVRPLYYGLVMFARLLGRHARLVHVEVSEPERRKLAVWAVMSGSRTLRVLLINKCNTSLRVTLRLPAREVARVQRLLAPSPTSSSHVTLAGQRLNGHARWVGHRVVQLVRGHGGRYATAVRRFSATLLSTRSAA